MSSISEFKSKVATDFARPNLFECTLNFPEATVANGTTLTELGKFTVKAANLPATQLGTVEVPYRGRVLKIAGDRTFEPWTITIMNDKNFKLRDGFEKWTESIQAYSQNVTSAGTNINNYFADMFVTQLDRNASSPTTQSTSSTSQSASGTPHAPLRAYRFVDVFPTNISAIDLDFGSNDAIEEFTVEMQVQYWEVALRGPGK
jgi:hypothetical protein|tara:strand:- start:995 stop:1603 length:609 start_codon:yes stop_codon:yes gene_type:complete